MPLTRLHTIIPWSRDLFIHKPSQLPGEHTARLPLPVHRTIQQHKPSLSYQGLCGKSLVLPCTVPTCSWGERARVGKSAFPRSTRLEHNSAQPGIEPNVHLSPLFRYIWLLIAWMLTASALLSNPLAGASYYIHPDAKYRPGTNWHQLKQNQLKILIIFVRDALNLDNDAHSLDDDAQPDGTHWQVCHTMYPDAYTQRMLHWLCMNWYWLQHNLNTVVIITFINAHSLEAPQGQQQDQAGARSKAWWQHLTKVLHSLPPKIPS